MNEQTKQQEQVPVTREERAPATWTPFSPFEDLDRLFDDFLSRRWLRPMGGRLAGVQPAMPKVDVVDQDESILVRAEVPGVERKDLDITVSDNTVTIKGERSSEKRVEKGDYYRCEISRGAFARTVALPCDVDTEKAAAEFTDGMLELTLPKVKESRRRKIEVQ